MIALPALETLLARHRVVATVLYAALVVVFVFVTTTTWLDLAARNAEVVAAADIRDQLGARGSARPRITAPTDVSVPAGSPFLEGATASVAGAALLQRLAVATLAVRGHVLSSQVDLQGPQAKAGFITATASLELEAPALQQLLYDLEAGMPMLFVEQLVAQAPTGTATTAGAKLRVLVSVAGQWQAPK